MDQLLVLVEDILQMSRIKSGTPLGEIDVCDLVDETKRTFENYIEEAETKKRYSPNWNYRNLLLMFALI